MSTQQSRYTVIRQKKIVEDLEEDSIQIPKPMVGFGIPTHPSPTFRRTLPEAAVGPPYFYYENVAMTPRGVWTQISRFLFEIKPEFVDSKHFSAAARKRGYVHNLPIENRFLLQPLPPLTIQAALPSSKKWWPSWDDRKKLNVLNTCYASAKTTQRLRESLEQFDGIPPEEIKKEVLSECKKFNLVWNGKNKLAVLEPDEMELILGYPKDHTRGVSRTDRYKSLGNSFQVDTVAYHLSVLKDMFPNGINVLSLFSGIGGAEVALHRLGIPLKNVVSVELSEVNRNIIRSWWEQTNQEGNLIELKDVQDLGPDQLESLVRSVGGFDLIIGGSPCNNLSGNNRHHRDGLQGDQSILFYDYCRILDVVKCVMGTMR
ncbi:DNA (cytosine-5)-methyltransferase drm2 [Ranunculus cassubicifolius]